MREREGERMHAGVLTISHKQLGVGQRRSPHGFNAHAHSHGSGGLST